MIRSATVYRFTGPRRDRVRDRPTRFFASRARATARTSRSFSFSFSFRFFSEKSPGITKTLNYACGPCRGPTSAKPSWLSEKYKLYGRQGLFLLLPKNGPRSEGNARNHDVGSFRLHRRPPTQEDTTRASTGDDRVEGYARPADRARSREDPVSLEFD